MPGKPYGASVDNVPPEVDEVYKEARNCMIVGAHTSAALMCRKILMNVAVHQGAERNQTFAQYVDFFNANGYIPPNGKKWFEYIRSKGNEATHEIPQVSRNDAELTIDFVRQILVLVYDFPSRIK